MGDPHSKCSVAITTSLKVERYERKYNPFRTESLESLACRSKFITETSSLTIAC